jgi:hypothetical protein
MRGTGSNRQKEGTGSTQSTSSNQEEPTRVHIPERGTGSIPMRGTSSNRERGYGRKRGTGSNQEGPTRVHILERDTGSIPIRGTSSNRERGYGFDSPNTGSNQEGPTHPREGHGFNAQRGARVRIEKEGTGSTPRKRGTGSNQEGPTRVHIPERDMGSIPMRDTSSNRERGYRFDSPKEGHGFEPGGT